MNNLSEIIQHIHDVLSPAIMISSAALLVLGFQNKLTALANRFRALTNEGRTLTYKEKRLPEENLRLESLKQQTNGLLLRIKFVKRSIFCVYGAILCFTGTSIIIFSNVFSPIKLAQLGIAIFGTGFILVFLAAFFMMQETRLLYRIIKLEHFL